MKFSFPIFFILLTISEIDAQSYFIDLVYPNQCNNTSQINSVFEDGDNIWFFTPDELFKQEENNCIAQGLSLNEQINQYSKSNAAGNFHWYRTVNKQSKFIKEGKIYDERDVQIQPDIDYTFIFNDLKENTLLVVEEGILDVKSGNVLPVNWKSYNKKDIWSYDIESNGRIWLINSSGGIYIIDKNLSSIRYRSIYESKYAHALFIDDEDVIWISFDNLILGVQNDSIKHRIPTKNLDKVTKILKDKNNVLWLKSRTLSFVHPTTFEIKSIFNNKDFTNLVVNDFTIASDDKIWIASNQGLYSHPGPAISFYSLDGAPNKKFRKQFFCLNDDKFLSQKKEVYLFNVDKDIQLKKQAVGKAPYLKKYLYNKEEIKVYSKGKESSYELNSHNLSKNLAIQEQYVVDYLHIPNSEKAIVLDHEKLKISGNESSSLYYKDISLSDNSIVTQLVPYGLNLFNNQIILHSNAGIFEVNYELEGNLKLDLIEGTEQNLASIPTQAISYYECLIIAYDKGVQVLNNHPKDGLKVKALNVLNGLHNVLDISQFKDQLWVGTNKNLVGYNLDSLCFVDKFESNYVIDFPEYQKELRVDHDKNGILWLYNGKKLLKFDNKLLTEKSRLENNSVLASFNILENSNKDSSKSSQPFKTLSKTSKDVTIELDPLKFEKGLGISYQYRVKSISDEWVTVPEDGKIIIDRMPFGNNEFEIRVCNIDGNCSITDVNVIKVRRPLIYNPWFYLLLVGLAALLIHLYFKRYRKKVQNKLERESELISIAMTAEEEEKKRISSEIHDGLGQSLILLKNKALLRNDNEYVNMVDQAIVEMRSLLNDLRPADIDKIGIKKALERLTEKLDANTSILFSHDLVEIDHLFTNTQKHHIYRIIQECYNNILKHSKAKSGRLTAMKYDNEIIFTVQDNGIGLKDESTNDSSGNGLNSIQNRTSHLGGKVNLVSRYPKGTKVEIHIPI